MGVRTWAENGNRAGDRCISLLKREKKNVYEASVIPWKNIYNVSGKAGNKLYTQCIHKYIKTRTKTNKKLCTGKEVLEGNMPSYLRLPGWWETGSFYFCHHFLHFRVFPIFYGKHAPLF